MSKSLTFSVALFAALSLGLAAPAAAQLPAANKTVHAEDLAAAGYATAMEGIRLLHPQMRLGRGIPSLDGQDRATPMVYLDGIRVEPSTLREIHRSALVSITYLDAMTATTRYGTNHQSGAIVVVTRAGR